MDIFWNSPLQFLDLLAILFMKMLFLLSYMDSVTVQKLPILPLRILKLKLKIPSEFDNYVPSPELLP